MLLSYISSPWYARLEGKASQNATSLCFLSEVLKQLCCVAFFFQKQHCWLMPSQMLFIYSLETNVSFLLLIPMMKEQVQYFLVRCIFSGKVDLTWCWMFKKS